jgi:hypothetical protein
VNLERLKRWADEGDETARDELARHESRARVDEYHQPTILVICNKPRQIGKAAIQELLRASKEIDRQLAAFESQARQAADFWTCKREPWRKSRRPR